MWSPDSPKWHIGLSARRLVRARMGGTWPSKIVACDNIACAPDKDKAPWQAAVNALARLLAEEGARGATLHVVLSGHFVRWQLLDWRVELTRQREIAAYARLRFAETFGKAAGDWDVLHSLQPPGKAVPACAVDAGLVRALHAVCTDAGARLAVVTPYFASAADHWRKTLGGKTAWFGLIEPDCVSLGLLRNGDWLGLHTQRVDSDWQDVLPGMMARIGITAGLGETSAPVYLVGVDEAPIADVTMPLIWLRPNASAKGAIDGCRMAMGV